MIKAHLMQNVDDISAVEPEPIDFDVIEIAGLVVPLLFAVMTIVLVALNPDPSATAATTSERPEERLEQIQRR
jgi:hypothetical protein